MTAKLTLLGLGLDPEQHATIETLQAAGSSDVVFWAGAESGKRLLSRFCRDVRAETSPERVFAELEAGKIVGWATPAHPVVYSPAAGVLVRRCEEAGIPWETFGAVSSAGVAMAASGITLGEDIFGVQAFDAAAVASGAARINPALHAVVHFYAPASLSELAAALARTYPAGHRAAWCSAAGIDGVTTVAELGAAALPPAGAVLLLDPAVASGTRWGAQFESRGRTEAAAVGDHKRAPAWVKG